MKVSLITVTLNAEQHLESCFRSVQQQDYPDIEHIIVDGKSTDGTLAIIHKHAGKISLWVSEADRGMYDALNKGMEMATGDIIGILNSDDMLAGPDVISSIVKCFENNQADAVFGDLEYVDRNDSSRILRIWKGKPYKRSLFKTGWMPAHPTFYIRRKYVAEFG
ncbi:MAG: glycosyltransferase family 2 protein, partial [Ferruginibacter sp.]